MRPRWYCYPPSSRLRDILKRISRRRILFRQDVDEISQRWCKKSLYFERAYGPVMRAVELSLGYGFFAISAGEYINREYAQLGDEYIKIKVLMPVARCVWCEKCLYAPHQKWHTHCGKSPCKDVAYFSRSWRTPKFLKAFPYSSPERIQKERLHFLARYLERKANDYNKHRKNQRRTTQCFV